MNQTFAEIKREIHGLEDAVRLACVWEAAAPKLGNVNPNAAFNDCDFEDFRRAANAIAPILGCPARTTRLGNDVLEAVRATRHVTRANVNLGIILLIAPLSRCRRDSDMTAVLSDLNEADSANVYEAIRLASPGGMKQADVSHQDDVQIATTPVQLIDVMRQAAHRDQIAMQYATNFRNFFEQVVPVIDEEVSKSIELGEAILVSQLRLMSMTNDTLIARKCGNAMADQARAHAISCLRNDSSQARQQLDDWLRADGNRRNPGTTADMIAAGLFWLLKGGISAHSVGSSTT